MKNKIDAIIEYFKLENESCLGASKYASLIIMVNNEEKIVKELLDKDYMFYGNLLLFLDYGLKDIIKDLDINSKHYSTDLINSICYVLGAFNSLDAEIRCKINGVVWQKYLNKGKGFNKDALKEEL